MRATLCFLAVLAGSPLAAQHSVVDSLAERARVLQRLADAAERADLAAKGRRASLPRDTVRVDPLTVLVPQGTADRVEAGVRRAAAQIGIELGPAAALLRGRSVEVAFGVGTTTSAGGVPVLGIPDSADTEAIATILVRWAGPLLAARGSPELRAWAPLPIGAEVGALARDAHVELVTAIPGASQHCLMGSLDACRTALGLTMPDDPVTAYWDAAGRREMVRRTTRRYYRGEWSRLSAQCLDDGDDAACTALLRSLFQNNRNQHAREIAPLGRAPRQVLMTVALERGGDGALARLLADSSATLVASLEAAAAQPIDTLLTLWRDRVSAARPEVRVPASARVFTLLWSLALAGLAMGGTRWRAG